MEDLISYASKDRDSTRTGLSYKFQRLREKLRQAIASGELKGKLPGERSLAKRFHVNAKTLSKALTDLAAEGLLDRSIGRGTFVKGQAPATVSVKRWLVVCDAGQADWELVQMLRAIHPELDVVTDVISIRPSFLNQFSAVLDLAAATPEAFLRDLVVRNIPVVVVGREPKTYSTHAVVFDAPLALAQLGRDLLLSGHRHMAAVEGNQHSVVTKALRKASARYAPEAKVDPCVSTDAATMVANGVTAFVCDTIDAARQIKAQLEKLGISVPGRVSLSAVGIAPENHAFSGYFVHPSEEVNAIVQLLNDTQSYRPTTLWLAGRSVDRGSVCSIPADPSEGRMRYGSAGA
jgi:DNA-binding transcriptional regulator YhcF (GntR family)